MKWNHQPSHGFRFFATDAIAILVCIAGTVVGLQALGSIAWLFPFVVSHFFLFCNVFRIPRHLELTWAGIFLFLATSCIVADVSILHSFWITLPVTIAILGYGMCRKGYRGIGSRPKQVEPSDSP